MSPFSDFTLFVCLSGMAATCNLGAYRLTIAEVKRHGLAVEGNRFTRSLLQKNPKLALLPVSLMLVYLGGMWLVLGWVALLAASVFALFCAADFIWDSLAYLQDERGTRNQ
jgi:hypothetical protein